MSPRRAVRPGDASLFVARVTAPNRCWRPRRLSRRALGYTVAGLVIAQAITACTLMLVSHGSKRRDLMRDVTVLGDVRSFMTEFSTLDPFHANDYVDMVLAHATGEFARQFKAKENLAVLGIAQGEPTTGTVLDAGVQRWNDDGSVNVLVAVDVSAKAPKGGGVTDTAYRWLVTTQKEGDQWKISSLVQVI